MKQFCKYYASEMFGQIVLIIQRGDEGDPEVRMFFQPLEGLGVLTLAYKYPDTEEGWDQAEEWFNNCTEKTAEYHVSKVMSMWQGCKDEVVDNVDIYPTNAYYNEEDDDEN